MTKNNESPLTNTAQICLKVMEATGPEMGSPEEHISAFLLSAAHLSARNPFHELSVEQVGELALAGADAMHNKLKDILLAKNDDGRKHCSCIITARVGSRHGSPTPGADIVKCAGCGADSWLSMESAELLTKRPIPVICGDCALKHKPDLEEFVKGLKKEGA
jgi:hypothetical protein